MTITLRNELAKISAFRKPLIGDLIGVSKNGTQVYKKNNFDTTTITAMQNGKVTKEVTKEKFIHSINKDENGNVSITAPIVLIKDFARKTKSLIKRINTSITKDDNTTNCTSTFSKLKISNAGDVLERKILTSSK